MIKASVLLNLVLFTGLIVALRLYIQASAQLTIKEERNETLRKTIRIMRKNQKDHVSNVDDADSVWESDLSPVRRSTRITNADKERADNHEGEDA